MIMKDINKSSDIIMKGVEYRARKHFLQGDYKNPYGTEEERDFSTDWIKSGMGDHYDKKMSELIRERLCPCCGQFTTGDIDW